MVSWLSLTPKSFNAFPTFSAKTSLNKGGGGGRRKGRKVMEDKTFSLFFSELFF